MKNKALKAFLLSILLGSLIILPNMIINKGIFTLSADYNYQQVPFNMIMNHSLKEGTFLWTWYNELGSNFIGTYSFYNLLSPFSIIGYLFKSNFYPYISGILTILKFGIAGLTSYLYLKRYVKNKNYAIIGSTLYAFSGYQLNNILFHFYDSVCLFPLALYALDNLIYDNKKHKLPFFIALLSITNWFMFIGQCVFICIYILIKILSKECTVKTLKDIIPEFITGILISSFILIPSLLFTMSNPRINNNWTIINMLKYLNSNKYFEIIRSLFFPSETMAPRAFLTPQNYDSVEFYLPVIGSILIISRLIKKQKSWDKTLMIALLIIMVIPILNSSFFMFTAKYYARWFYMATLIGSLISVKELENIEKKTIKISTIISFSVLILSIIYYIIISKKHPMINFIFDKQYIILTIGLMLINILITNITIKKPKILLIAICIFITIWGNYTIYNYSETGFNQNKKYKEYLNTNINTQSRINSENCKPNLSAITKSPNIRTFNTNINGSNFKFYNSIDLERTVSTIIDVNDNLNEFLSIEYIIDCEKNNIKKINNKEIGLLLNYYIEDEEFKKLEPEEKKKQLLNKMILTEKQIEQYKNLFNPKTKIINNSFKYMKNGFESNIELSDEALILYTIPYDSGWKAKVNKKTVKIEEIDNGLIGIKLNKGINNIKFEYKTPGLKAGIILSIISLTYEIIKNIKKTTKKQTKI